MIHNFDINSANHLQRTFTDIQLTATDIWVDGEKNKFCSEFTNLSSFFPGLWFSATGFLQKENSNVFCVLESSKHHIEVDSRYNRFLTNEQKSTLPKIFHAKYLGSRWRFYQGGKH